jgi:L-lactate utilization protein LutB
MCWPKDCPKGAYHENQANQYVSAARAAIQTPELGEAVAFATDTASAKRQIAMDAYGHDHGEAMRQQAAEARRRSLRQLPELPNRPRPTCRPTGSRLWARDGDEACHASCAHRPRKRRPAHYQK